MSLSASKTEQLGYADNADTAGFHGFLLGLIRADLLHPRHPRIYFLLSKSVQTSGNSSLFCLGAHPITHTARPGRTFQHLAFLQKLGRHYSAQKGETATVRDFLIHTLA